MVTEIRSVKDSWEGLQFGSCSQRPLPHIGHLRIPTQMLPPPLFLPPCRKLWSDISGLGHSCLGKSFFTYPVTSNYTLPSRWGGKKSSFQAIFTQGSPQRSAPTPDEPTKAPVYSELTPLPDPDSTKQARQRLLQRTLRKKLSILPNYLRNKGTKLRSILFTNRNTVKKNRGEKWCY